jgi:hypothetical protein
MIIDTYISQYITSHHITMHRRKKT